jgi:hypothetical protein
MLAMNNAQPNFTADNYAQLETTLRGVQLALKRISRNNYVKINVDTTHDAKLTICASDNVLTIIYTNRHLQAVPKPIQQLIAIVFGNEQKIIFSAI